MLLILEASLVSPQDTRQAPEVRPNQRPATDSDKLRDMFVFLLHCTCSRIIISRVHKTRQEEDQLLTKMKMN